jgi:uncharacterized protein (DUF1778 family)
MAGKKKPKVGRPPLPKGEARDVVFTLRLSESERDAIAAAAKEAGKPPTQWARELLLERARET